jgi:Fic family protein
LLDSPILYLSQYIIRNKSAYYRLLQDVRTKNRWEDWVLYMLEGIEQTAEETLALVKKINNAVEQTSEYIKTTISKLYSKELVELLFFEFYTKIAFIEKGLCIPVKSDHRFRLKMIICSGSNRSVSPVQNDRSKATMVS